MDDTLSWNQLVTWDPINPQYFCVLGSKFSYFSERKEFLFALATTYFVVLKSTGHRKLSI